MDIPESIAKKLRLDLGRKPSKSTPQLIAESPQQPTPNDNIQQVVQCAARQAVNSLSCEYADVVVNLNGVYNVLELDGPTTTTTLNVSPDDDRYDAAAQFLLDYDAELTDVVSGSAASVVSSIDEMILRCFVVRYFAVRCLAVALFCSRAVLSRAVLAYAVLRCAVLQICRHSLDLETQQTNFCTISKAMSGSSMQIDDIESSPATSNREEKSLDSSSSQNGLCRSDLALLCSFFYLPFENGIVCKQTLNDLMWLNGNLFESEDKQMPILHNEEKERRLAHIQKICKLVDNLCSKLSKCPNRSFVFDVYQHAYDLQGVLNILLSFLQWAEMFRIPVTEVLNRKGISSKMILGEAPVIGKMPDETPGDFEPWISRCSFLTECQ
uniref:Uncharacterized protein n=1 Tax=Romanomermis culicivorax TaxID=13658 RepID=A0A915K6M9_ROMCU